MNFFAALCTRYAVNASTFLMLAYSHGRLLSCWQALCLYLVQSIKFGSCKVLFLNEHLRC